MNPELPQVRPSAESMPQIPGGVEYFPDGTHRSPEVSPGGSPEFHAAPAERAPQPAPAAPVVNPSQIAVPQVPAPAPSAASDSHRHVGLVSGSPAAAADDDLIEKEWVDKAKKIISLTKGNPYEQAKAIAALQSDYLKKRYDREIGQKDSAGIR